MNPIPIGWATVPVSCILRQGGSGVLRVACTVTKADGSPLDAYDGWTAQAVLMRSATTAPELILDSDATGDPAGMRFVVDLDFRSAITKGIRAGNLVGDLCLTDPDGERHYPVSLSIEIERSFAPAPEVA